jgi:DNA polymerase III alpha subunit (gram-positive type)
MEDWKTGVVPVSTLVHHPKVPVEVEALTGITTAMLTGQPEWATVQQQVASAIARCATPTCVAYNGNSFDHKIMRRLHAFGDVHYDDPVPIVKAKRLAQKLRTYKLSTVFSELGLSNPVAHRAEADVFMMRHVMDVYL